MVECLEKIDDAEDEKGKCPTKGDFEKLAWSHTGGKEGCLPLRILILPAIARPPITAPAVQSPCPTTAPAVTHQ